MDIKTYSDPSAFQSATRAFLEEREVENNLILGIIDRAAAGQAPVPGMSTGTPLLLSIEEEGRLVAVAVRTPPFRLVLTQTPALAVGTLADYLARHRQALPGVLGPSETAHLFITAWSKLSRQRIRPGRAVRLHALKRVEFAGTASGSFRQASDADLDLLASWHHAFWVEVGEHMAVDDRAAVATLLHEQKLFVWCDPQPVSMAVWMRPTTHGVCINAVYTPPSLRGRGYATTCVAALSQHLFDRGRSFCCLFTDLANPISNRIYRRIGYRPVGDFTEYEFE